MGAGRESSFLYPMSQPLFLERMARRVASHDPEHTLYPSDTGDRYLKQAVSLTSQATRGGSRTGPAKHIPADNLILAVRVLAVIRRHGEHPQMQKRNRRDYPRRNPSPPSVRSPHRKRSGGMREEGPRSPLRKMRQTHRIRGQPAPGASCPAPSIASVAGARETGTSRASWWTATWGSRRGAAASFRRVFCLSRASGWCGGVEAGSLGGGRWVLYFRGAGGRPLLPSFPGRVSGAAVRGREENDVAGQVGHEESQRRSMSVYSAKANVAS